MYKAILLHPKGDYVTDFESDTIQEVWDGVNNMGSCWIFYPVVVIVKNKTIVDTCEGLEMFKKCKLETLIKFLKNELESRGNEIFEMFNCVMSIQQIYKLK